MTQALAESKRIQRVPPEAHAVYRRFPSAVRSSDWPEIRRLAVAGRHEDAQALAAEHEGRHPRLRAENVVSRRLRTLRLKLFSAQNKTDEEITTIFSEAADWLSGRLANIGTTPASIARAGVLAHQAMVAVRVKAGVALRDAIWQSARMGLRTPGEAFAPIFKDNVESFSGDIAEQAILESVMELAEDRLSFGIDPRIASRDPSVKITSPTWSKTLDRIYKSIVERNNEGLTLSHRIYDLTDQTERSLRRMLAREISRGTAPRDIARNAARYLNDEVAAGDAAGAGIYRRPSQNLMRLARTETNRAYANASTAWANGKTWLQAVTWTLSSAHEKVDECDDLAGETMTPDEFDSQYPPHPQCMCYPTFVIKDEYLTDYADSGDEINPGGTD